MHYLLRLREVRRKQIRRKVGRVVEMHQFLREKLGMSIIRRVVCSYILVNFFLFFI